MAQITTAFLDELICTDYLDFGKCQDRIGQFSSKKDSNYLVEKNQSVQERLQHTFSPGSKHYNGRNRFHPNCTIEESAGTGSRKLAETKICPRYRLQQDPRLWGNNSKIFPKRLTLWTLPTGRFV